VIRLAVRVDADHAEIVLAELLELAPAGVEEAQPAPGVVEYAVYGPPGELPSLHDIDAVVGEARVEISTSEIPDDWHERWRRFHRAVLIEAPRVANAASPPVPSLHVRPPWEPARPAGASPLEEIVIDPGQAFGTGGHASTRLCLALLLALGAETPARGSLIDVGTGSGVLAISAARLGYRPVLALDHESESVQAARENALVNGEILDVRRHDLRSGELPLPAVGVAIGSSVVLANLLRPLLLDLAERLPAAPAHLIAGGLLAHEADEVSAAFSRRLGLHERERRQEGEWAAVWMQAGG
jgi:ribosomal protein L11 methyltransferase